jgi:hypothetical protein
LLFAKDAALSIQGTLLINGRKDAPVELTGKATGEGFWQGVRINRSDATQSREEHRLIRKTFFFPVWTPKLRNSDGWARYGRSWQCRSLGNRTRRTRWVCLLVCLRSFRIDLEKGLIEVNIGISELESLIGGPRKSRVPAPYGLRQHAAIFQALEVKVSKRVLPKVGGFHGRLVRFLIKLLELGAQMNWRPGSDEAHSLDLRPQGPPPCGDRRCSGVALRRAEKSFGAFPSDTRQRSSAPLSSFSACSAWRLSSTKRIAARRP